jgi:membrane protein YqaA with SNARE-associated domain
MLGEHGYSCGVLVGERAAAVAQRVALGALRPSALAERGRNASTPQKVLALVAVVVFNVGLFLVPIDYAGLGAFAYPGAFLITLVANAAVVVPVPYIPIVAHIATTADSAAVVVLIAALGSALGESVAFFVGRVEKDLFTGHPWFERLRVFFCREWRAGLFLFLFAMPLNPVFDVGGLGAGALGISFRTFFVAVLLGRIVRFTVIALIAFGLIGLIQIR